MNPKSQEIGGRYRGKTATAIWKQKGYGGSS